MTTKRSGAAGRAPKATKPTRVPVSQQNKLNFDKRDGFHRRLVNDDANGQNVQSFKEGGWKIVEKPNQDKSSATNVESQMGTQVRRSVGNNMRAVLMEIPDKLFNADKKLKLKQIDNIEKGLLRTDRGKTVTHTDGTYGGVEIERRR